MRSLNVRTLLIATAAGVFGVQTVGTAVPCPPGDEKEPTVVAAATYVQDKGVYKVVDTTITKANTIVLKANKDGRVVEVRVQPIDTTKKEYVIVADTISIADVRGKATGNLVLTAEGNVALAALAVKRTPSVQIGLVTEAVSKALAGHLKIRAEEALIVTGVLEGLPAAKAGLKEHDVITRVDGVHVITHQKLKEVLSKCIPGQIIALRVLREGEPTEVNVRVEAIEPKGYSVTRTDGVSWWREPMKLEAKLSLVQPRASTVVTQEVGPQLYLTVTEPQRIQKFVTIDPKISTQILEVKPVIDVQRRWLTLRNFEFTDSTNELAKATKGESLEARLLAELATLEQQLAKLKVLIVELEATSNNEAE